jgi:hypothetical protein
LAEIKSQLGKSVFFFLFMSRVVSIYLQSVTFGMIPVRSLTQLTQLESSSDQAERSLISHLRAQVAKGVIRLVQESTSAQDIV